MNLQRTVNSVLTVCLSPRDHPIERIKKDHSNLQHLHLFLDSGTTITPAFRPLFFKGLPLEAKQFTIHTNNLAGIDELHKLPQVELESSPLHEEDFNLLPGSPLSKYRATTDPDTNPSPKVRGPMANFLETIWDEKIKTDNRVIAVAVVTANWLLAGPGLDSLQICSRGRGHLEFKKMLIEHCDYVVVVTPLAKILRVEDVGVLNKLMDEQHQFRSFLLPVEKRDETYLLTTHRPHHSLSPLRNITIELQNLSASNGSKNYRLWERCEDFDPPGDLREEVMASECPHAYVRDAFEKMYGITPYA